MRDEGTCSENLLNGHNPTDTCRTKLSYSCCRFDFPPISRSWCPGWGWCVCGGGLQLVQSLSRGAPGGWSRACCPGLCHWLWVGPASLPPALPPPPSSSISSLSLSRPSHPSCINWVWCWNPPLAAHAHVQPAAVKTSMFSATIMIIAAEHSAEGISKSD